MSFLRLGRALPLSLSLASRFSPSVIRVPSARLALSLSLPRSQPLRMASSAPAAHFAEGEDPQQLGPDTEMLQQQGWALDGNGMGVTKTFHFKSYFKAVSFVNLIASESSSKKHHPTMTVRFGSVDVHWTTHHPRGLTHKDITMARHCDHGASLMGAVDSGQGLKCGPSA
ncbi:Transcriptional coactivator/pterin dehydratase [Penicillium waksmanii]|uniref:Transcriptional coactivator/pterin dehydratase n=1 Tax=Penicillium waksmanii TaxID=69791 RepID=UPI002548F79C|nr:Transcriptional coactivator/pterin dehydratase [Penicillium waksmanii]KAJ5974572.1 Transcriptional coactivator/pterin dehydratase [Penicillium waksmanii]